MTNNHAYLRSVESVTSMSVYVVAFLLSLLIATSNAGPVGVGLCYSACNAGYVSCLAASGIVAGTTGPVGWWAWLTGAGAACNATQGICMSACTALIVAPIP
jgi:hypothetical protein